MKKGILFDLDGTLWDSSEQVTKSWNKCIREQTDRSEQITAEDMRSYMGKTLEQIAALIFPAVEEEERLRILRLCSTTELDYLRGLTGDEVPSLFPDECDIIRELAKKYTLGVVSNCQVGYIEIYLDKISFADAFTDMECAGNTGLSKGENIRLVMQRQGITDCVYVGDTQGDADAAKAAGIPFIHAAYGFGTVDECAAVLDDIRDLPKLVRTVI